jgi:hypothetical protein
VAEALRTFRVLLCLAAQQKGMVIKMKNIFTASKCGIAMLLALCILLGIAGTGVHATAMTAESTVVTDENTQELVPVMAKMCYDCHTVDDCMRDISSIYGFSYSPSGNSYTCSGNYSVTITNAHNYLNVSLFYNRSCIEIYTCFLR